MRITQVVLDGFKSYAKRTVVGPLDASFNAITGRNGTGKSNVLDAICFVLGISKLSKVRVKKQTELIYKNGTAGITRAMVAITFDNSGARKPVGYEDCAEIVVERTITFGGKSTCRINGRAATRTKLCTMFQSVGLDVNNPNFLIMQGSITGIMKQSPAATLMLLEEAAGTRMFENQKQSSIATIENKERQVTEIDRNLTEQVAPQLAKLRADADAINKHTAQAQRITRLERRSTVLTFQGATKSAANAADASAALAPKIAAAEERRAAAATTLAERLVEEEALKKHKDGTLASEFRRAQKEEEKAATKRELASTKLEHQQETVDEEEKQKSAISAKIAKTNATITANARAIETADAERATKQVAVDEAAAATVAAQESLQELMVGSTEGNGSDASVEERILAAEAIQVRSKGVVKRKTLEKNHLAKSLKSTTAKLRKAEKENVEVARKKAALETEVAEASAALTRIDYTPEAESAARSDVAASERSVRELRQEKEGLERTRKRFHPPLSSALEKNRNVKGYLASLFTVRDPAHIPAIEAAAGGKLYNIVTADVATAKKVIKSSRRKVTCAPLAALRAATLSKAKLGAARAVALERGGTVSRLIDLVDVHPDHRIAVQYALGNVLLCDKPATAQCIALGKGRDAKLRCKTITLDGDIYDPAGKLEGGSRKKKEGVLTVLHRLAAVTTELNEREDALREQLTLLKTLRKRAASFKTLQNRAEMKAHEFALLAKRIAGSSFGVLQQQVEDYTVGLEAAVAAIDEAKVAATKAQAECKVLLAQAAELKRAREAEFSKRQKFVTQCKKGSVAATKALGKVVARVEEKTIELEELRELSLELSARVGAAEDSCAASRATLVQLNEKLAAEEAQFASCHEAFEAKRLEIAEWNSKLAQIVKQNSRDSRTVSSAESQLKKLAKKEKKVEDAARSTALQLEQLHSENPWIASEMQYWDGSEVEGGDASTCTAELAALLKMQVELEKTLNRKAAGMLQDVEEQYHELVRKRQIIKRDKESILDTIEGLKERQMQTLGEAYAKVNSAFNEIFSSFLRECRAEAKLHRVFAADGVSVVGLKIMVAFNGDWKESLAELSGGQKSLLALSLLLAMLMYKPAPMYILDEVDSALDLNHTQNIGRLLPTRFKNSQFIVVSHKEGMFDNANVVFTTQNVDGISSVSRTETGAASRRAGAAGAAGAKVAKGRVATGENARRRPTKSRRTRS